MLYTEKTKMAIQYAYDKHNGQFDKSGLAYILHPVHIADWLCNQNPYIAEEYVIVALLHDVLEDCAKNSKEQSDILLELNKMFGDKVTDALVLLCHKKGEPYYDYIQNLSKNEIARQVKIADLTHNADLSRLSQITDEDIARSDKYKNALQLLGVTMW